MKKMARGLSLVLGGASWSAESAGGSRTLAQLVGPEGNLADLIYPDGHRERVELTAR